MTELKSLQNHFLIAMPTLDDPYFSRSLTYICEHNDEGAMGLVLNQPSTMNLKQLLEQTDKTKALRSARRGPVCAQAYWVSRLSSKARAPSQCVCFLVSAAFFQYL